MTKTVLLVEGMMCDVCKGKVDYALKSMAGVTEVKINVSAGKAEVWHNDLSSPEDLVAAVVNAGFTAKVKRGLFK